MKTMAEFKQKYAGHSITRYDTVSDMCTNCVGNIHFYKNMLKATARRDKYIRQNYEETIRAYEHMLRELEDVI